MSPGRQRSDCQVSIQAGRRRTKSRKGMAQSTQLVSLGGGRGVLAGRASAARAGRLTGNVSVLKASVTATRAPSGRDLRPENVEGDFAVDHTCIGEAGLCYSARPLWPSYWTISRVVDAVYDITC